jgi:hypothetical protein
MEPDNLTPLPSATTSAGSVPDLQAQYDGLRQLVNSLLVIMLLVSGTLLIFLYWEVRNTNRELEAGASMVYQYQHGAGPVQDKFVKDLQEYGRTHADYAPILKKYNIPPAPTPGASPGLMPNKK